MNKIRMNKNTKAPISLIFILSLFSLSSCCESKFLDKPNETNLEFWITEEVDDESLKKCSFLPGLFLGEMYLDSRYKAVDGGTRIEAPKIHVVYTVTAYPDYSNGGSYITGINITDSNINVYGLTLSSSQKDISKTLGDLGFTNSGINRWEKNNCVFDFKESYVSIGAYISNDKGLIF